MAATSEATGGKMLVVVIADPPAGDKLAEHLRETGRDAVEVEYLRGDHSARTQIPKAARWVLVMNGGDAGPRLKSEAEKIGARFLRVPPGWAATRSLLEQHGFYRDVVLTRRVEAVNSGPLMHRPLAAVANAIADQIIEKPGSPQMALLAVAARAGADAARREALAAPQAPASAPEAPSGGPAAPEGASEAQGGQPAPHSDPAGRNSEQARAKRLVSIARGKARRHAALAVEVNRVLDAHPSLTKKQVGSAVRERGHRADSAVVDEMVDCWRRALQPEMAIPQPAGVPAALMAPPPGSEPPHAEVITEATGDSETLPASVRAAEQALVVALRAHPEVCSYTLTVVGGEAESEYEVEVRKVAKTKARL